jgi:methylmalonyl-CoA mutase N-terminal domain/subunit
MGERRSRSGIPLRDFYEGAPGEAGSVPPGQFPYTRGRRATAPDTGGWIQRELSGEGEPERSNAQIKYLISKRQSGIDVIGDSPTMALLDPDHPLAAGTVGTQGVSLCCKDDYLALFRDLPLAELSISSSVPPLFAMTGLYLAAKAMGIAPALLRGSVLQAPFYAEDCGYAMHLPFDLRVRLAADVMQFCAVEMPRFHAYVEDTYFFSETGLTGVEEMALGFVEIRYLVREMLRRGVPIDSFAPRIAILVNCSMDFFEEIAKIRATRRLFARMMREEFGAQDPRSWSVVISCHTSGLTLTAQQPFNNIVRGTVQALAMVLGGVQALEISAFDEAYRTPSRESHLVALRTQQVLDLEAGAARVVDPLGGSHYVEALTDEMERRILAQIGEIEALGPPAALSDQGWFRNFFRDAMERYQKQISQGDLPVVGLNVHPVPPEEDTLLREATEQKLSPCIERVARIRAFKEARDGRRVRQALQAVLAAARRPEENLVLPVIAASEADCTMGEIAGTLRQAYGRPYDPHGLLPPMLEAGRP